METENTPVCDFCEDGASIFQSLSTEYPGCNVGVDEMFIESSCDLATGESKRRIAIYLSDLTEIRSRPLEYCPFCGRKF